MQKITREQLLDAVSARMPEERPRGNSLAARGAQVKWDRANDLLRKLRRGGTPSTQQVVAYFGAGARFVD